MAVRTLSQIVNELNKADSGQINLIKQRQSLIPKQIAAEEKGLGAKQEQAFGSILGGARQRGLGFSGIPLEEQAKYTSTEYLPALARLRQTGQEQQMSLTEAIMGIRSGNSKMAQGLRQQELDRAEQIRQFNTTLAEQRAARAAASGGGGGGFGGFGMGVDVPASGGGGGGYGMKRRSDGSYAFVDQRGNAVSAAAYSAAAGVPFRTLLSQMAQGGDKGAKSALGFVGDDYGYNPNKLGNNAALYNALTWGAMPRAANTKYKVGSSSSKQASNPANIRWF